MDFSKFDKEIDAEKIGKQIEEAKNNSGDTPKGFYFGMFEKFEIGETKDHRPMFKCQFRIHGKYADGEDCCEPTDDYKNKCVFMNKVIYGTKDDSMMIASLIGWLEHLECDFPIEFKSYSQFNDVINDIFEDIDEVEFDIEYDEKKFNSISILGETENE